MRARSLTIGLVTALAALAGAGCQKALFPEHLPRSQYERYGELRGQRTVLVEPGRYGVEQPALRQRLRPLDQH